MALGNDAALGCELSQNVDGVRDHDDRRTGSELASLQRVENSFEESDVSVDEVQSSLIGLSAKPSRNDYAVATIDDSVLVR